MGQGIPGCTNRLSTDTGEQPHRKKSGDPCQWQVECGSPLPWSQEGQPYPERHQVQHHRPGEGDEFLTNTSKSKPRIYKFLFTLKIFPCSYINSTFPYYDCICASAHRLTGVKRTATAYQKQCMDLPGEKFILSLIFRPMVL